LPGHCAPFHCCLAPPRCLVPNRQQKRSGRKERKGRGKGKKRSGIGKIARRRRRDIVRMTHPRPSHPSMPSVCVCVCVMCKQCILSHALVCVFQSTAVKQHIFPRTLAPPPHARAHKPVLPNGRIHSRSSCLAVCRRLCRLLACDEGTRGRAEGGEALSAWSLH